MWKGVGGPNVVQLTKEKGGGVHVSQKRERQIQFKTEQSATRNRTADRTLHKIK
jgi:hypothetical protein